MCGWLQTAFFRNFKEKCIRSNIRTPGIWLFLTEPISKLLRSIISMGGGGGHLVEFGNNRRSPWRNIFAQDKVLTHQRVKTVWSTGKATGSTRRRSSQRSGDGQNTGKPYTPNRDEVPERRRSWGIAQRYRMVQVTHSSVFAHLRLLLVGRKWPSSELSPFEEAHRMWRGRHRKQIWKIMFILYCSIYITTAVLLYL